MPHSFHVGISIEIFEIQQLCGCNRNSLKIWKFENWNYGLFSNEGETLMRCVCVLYLCAAQNCQMNSKLVCSCLLSHFIRSTFDCNTIGAELFNSKFEKINKTPEELLKWQRRAVKLTFSAYSSGFTVTSINGEWLSSHTFLIKIGSQIQMNQLKFPIWILTSKFCSFAETMIKMHCVYIVQGAREKCWPISSRYVICRWNWF